MAAARKKVASAKARAAKTATVVAKKQVAQKGIVGASAAKSVDSHVGLVEATTAQRSSSLAVDKK